ncbi:TPR repeat region-containing protein [Rhodococcus sp. NPDC003383]
MTPTQTSVARWQPQHLGGTADAIDGAQRRLAAIARSVHRDVSLMRDHDCWVSDAQAAAEERAEFESRRMLRCAESVESVGAAYRSALGSIGTARTHLLDTVAAAHAAGASVGDDWQVAAGSVEDPQEVDYWRWRVGQAVTALTDADAEAARAVRNALDALRALVPEQLGTSGLEARELAVKITGGEHLTAADIDNLLRDLRGIQPTAEQLEALARGEHIVMSQATLDYVRELYGTLGVDGFVKLSEQVSMEGSAEGQRLLANGLALASGPETGSGGMPAGVAEFFDKPATTGVVVGNPPVFLTAVPDSGLLDRFAQSYGVGDAALQQDNPINRALLEQVGELAALDPGPRSAIELRDAGSTTFDGLLEHLVAAGGRDQESVHEMVVDPDSREDRILPLLQHDWSDSGEPAVARMFEWIADDATATGDDPWAMERATRAGETAFGLSQLLSGHHAELLDVPGTDGKSIGELNPAVTQGLARAVAPYLADMVGVPGEETGTHGYGALGFRNAPLLYAVLSSDVDAAGHLTAQASTSVASLEQVWATSGATNTDSRIHYGVWAGRLAGLVEAGLDLELENRRNDAEDALDRRGLVFDSAKAALYGSASFVPVAGPFLATGIDVASPSVREAYLSTADRIESMTANASTDTSRTASYYNMALGVQAANGGRLPADSAWTEYTTEDGRLQTLTEIEGERPDTELTHFSTRTHDALTAADLPLEAFFSAFENARQDVDR